MTARSTENSVAKSAAFMFFSIVHMHLCEFIIIYMNIYTVNFMFCFLLFLSPEIIFIIVARWLVELSVHKRTLKCCFFVHAKQMKNGEDKKINRLLVTAA